jgi:hypothetical protein
MTVMCICGAWIACGDGAVAVPDATPGGGAVWAAAATDAIASAPIAPPINVLVMTPCLLLVIDRELNHPSLLAIERKRNGRHRAGAGMDGK